MTKLVFVVGGAGAGKTTLAKALARRRRMALFDMDTMLRPAAEAMMSQAGFDPSDRDSAEYKRLCRDLGYRITMDAALENASIGTDAIVIGPFTRELDDPHWIEGELAKLQSDGGIGIGMSGSPADEVEVKVIAVYLPSEQHYYERIRTRGSALDEWKLNHWDAFSASLARRGVRWKLPEGSILEWDNAGPLNEERLAKLERFVFGASPAPPEADQGGMQR